MGTTASVVYIWEGGSGERKAIVGNVGDSRVYLLRNGRLKQITLDDNCVRLTIPNKKQARLLQSKLNNITDPQSQLTDSEQMLFNSLNKMTTRVLFLLCSKIVCKSWSDIALGYCKTCLSSSAQVL